MPQPAPHHPSPQIPKPPSKPTYITPFSSYLQSRTVYGNGDRCMVPANVSMTRRMIGEGGEGEVWVGSDRLFGDDRRGRGEDDLPEVDIDADDDDESKNNSDDLVLQEFLNPDSSHKLQPKQEEKKKLIIRKRGYERPKTPPPQEKIYLPPHAAKYLPKHVKKLLYDDTTLTVLSYNILSHANAKKLTNHSRVPPEHLTWLTRRAVLLNEVISMNADVVCLQDCDDFVDFWQPMLSNAGYDSIFHKRTETLRPRSEGVVISYRRDKFQLFRSSSLDLNDAVDSANSTLSVTNARLASRCVNDDVAVMCCLQPWEGGGYPTGVTVVCAGLYSSTTSSSSSSNNSSSTSEDEQIRQIQSHHLLKTLSFFNADFNLPIIICGAINSPPGSVVYEIFNSGCTPVDPTVPGVPVGGTCVVRLDRFGVRDVVEESVGEVKEKKRLIKLKKIEKMKADGVAVPLSFADEEVVYTPEVVHLATSHSSVVLEWNECSSSSDQDQDDVISPEVLGYWVTWRIGGSTSLAFKDKRFYKHDDCIAPDTDTNPSTSTDTPQQKGTPEESTAQSTEVTPQNSKRRAVVTGLSSGVTYEFKVAGANAIGIGQYTRVSLPISTTKIHPRNTGKGRVVRRTLVIESRHPYNADEDVRKSVLLAGCKYGATVEFDRKCHLEVDADLLCFYAEEDGEQLIVAQRQTGIGRIKCIFDGNFKLSRGKDFPTLVNVCGEDCKGGGEFGDDKTFTYGFFSDDENQFWGYKFTITWDDYTSLSTSAKVYDDSKLSRIASTNLYLSDTSSVKLKQDLETEESSATVSKVNELNVQMRGTIMLNGNEVEAPVSNITPRYMNGERNVLTAPVRKQDLSLFPSYGLLGQDEEGLEEGEEEGVRIRIMEAAVGKAGGGMGEARRIYEETVRRRMVLDLKRVQSTPPPTSSSSSELISSSNNTSSNSNSNPKTLTAGLTDATLSIHHLAHPSVTGLPTKTQVHYLRLKSAYSGYCSSGEPLYNSVDCVNGQVGMCGYIFASEEGMVCMEVLSVPELEGIEGGYDASEGVLGVDGDYGWDGFDESGKIDKERRREALELSYEVAAWKEEDENDSKEVQILIDIEDMRNGININDGRSRPSTAGVGSEEAEVEPEPIIHPIHVQRLIDTHTHKRLQRTSKVNPRPHNFAYSGTYQPELRENCMRRHCRIPNGVYGSNHFAVVAKFRFNVAHIQGIWRGGD